MNEDSPDIGWPILHEEAVPVQAEIASPCRTNRRETRTFRVKKSEVATAKVSTTTSRRRLREAGKNRILMRHTRPVLALAIGSFTLAVILPAWLGGLVSAAWRPQLLLPHSFPTPVATISLPGSHLAQTVKSVLHVGSQHLRMRRPLTDRSVVIGLATAPKTIRRG
jgi:hypothetical protein